MEIQILSKSDELLQCFLAGRNQQTLEAYRTDLEDFKVHLGESELTKAVSKFIALQPGEANSSVLRYRNTLIERGLQSSTINRRLAAIRSLVKMGRMIGVVTWAIEIPNLKVETYRDTKGPGRIAIQEMLSLLERDPSPKHVRDYAILRLLYDLGLRASEVTKLDVTDVSLKESSVSIVGKGKTQKIKLSLPIATSEAVSAWVSIRDPNEPALFYNFERGGVQSRLTRVGLYQVIRRLGEDVGVKTRPHGIRHTSITQAIKIAQVNGITLPEVKQFSRHSSLQTLQIYADRERNVQGKLAGWVSDAVSSVERKSNEKEEN